MSSSISHQESPLLAFSLCLEMLLHSPTGCCCPQTIMMTVALDLLRKYQLWMASSNTSNPSSSSSNPYSLPSTAGGGATYVGNAYATHPSSSLDNAVINDNHDVGGVELENIRRRSSPSTSTSSSSTLDPVTRDDVPMSTQQPEPEQVRDCNDQQRCSYC